MLILSRHDGESIVIGDTGVTLSILRVKPRSGSVRVGIAAPPGVRVRRGETIAATEREQAPPPHPAEG